MRHNTKASVTTRSLVLDGMTRSLALDDADWRDLEEVAKENDLTLAEVVDSVEVTLRHHDNLSSAVRAYLGASRERH